MRIEYINPFVEATFEILSEVIKDGSVTRGSISLKKSPTPEKGVSIIVGLTGPSSGRVILDMSKETALHVISKMQESQVDQIGEMEKSTLGELANMIIGNAIAKLYKKGFTFALTPPTVITGTDYNIETPQIETLVIPITTKCGLIELNVALRES